MLRQSALLVSPECLASLVIGMTVQTGILVQRALVGYLKLVHSIVVNLVHSTFLSLLRSSCDRRCQAAKGQAHEYAVKPHLIGVDGLVPVYLVGHCSGLILQLLHHCLHRQQVLNLGPLLIHTCHKVTCTYVVEVVFQNVVSTDVALGVNHRVGILLAVVAYLLAAMCQICVQHCLKLYTHHVTPSWLRSKVQQIASWHSLHLRVCHPLRIALVWHLLQHQRTVYYQVLILHILGLAYLVYRLAVHTVKLTVAHSDVVHSIRQRVSLVAYYHHTILRLLAGHVLHQHVAYRWVVSSAANLLWLVVSVNLQHSLLAHAYFYVAHVDVLYHTTATAVCLDTQHTLQFRRIHHAVVSIHILATS